MLIYHITSKEEWQKQKSQSTYVPIGYAHDGFIHCSTSAQIWTVANNFFFGISDLLALQIDTDKLEIPPVFENLEGGSELFPHLYSPLPVAAVMKVVEFYIGPEQN